MRVVELSLDLPPCLRCFHRWNTAMAAPPRTWGDVVAVTARCSHHAYTYPPSEHLAGRWVFLWPSHWLV